jgi:hypothetical protein
MDCSHAAAERFLSSPIHLDFIMLAGNAML